MQDPDVQDNEMELHPPNKSASDWEIDTVYALRIFLHPRDNLNALLPEELEPSQEQMAGYEVLLDGSLNEQFFRTPALWNQT